MLLSHTAQREGELLTFLRGELALSSGLVKRLKWRNAFFLDGAPVHTNARVKPGQEITVRIEEAPEGFLPQALPIDILYEDAYMIALDNSPGSLSIRHRAKTRGRWQTRCWAIMSEQTSPAASTPSQGSTATPSAWSFWQKTRTSTQSSASDEYGAIHKTYLASVFGCPEQPAGEIALPVYKLGNGSLLRMVGRQKSAPSAATGSFRPTIRRASLP